MKIFISHSSHDKWVARQISALLESDGATTFLDEKDIETGESLDDSIHANLKDSDELLVILSPASIKSPWVLIEIGGARALGKYLVPILLHVGPNELPGPLVGRLARDINDLDRYRAEVKGRMASEDSSPAPPPVATATRPQAGKRSSSSDRVTFKVGDTVRIASRRPSPDDPDVQTLGWIDAMDELRGRTAKVTAVFDPRDGTDNIGFDGVTVELDIDDGMFYWAASWLTPFDPNEDLRAVLLEALQTQVLGSTSPDGAAPDSQSP